MTADAACLAPVPLAFVILIWDESFQCESCAIVFAHFSGTLTTNKTGVCRFCFEISGIMGHSFASVLPLYIKLKVSFP